MKLVLLIVLILLGITCDHFAQKYLTKTWPTKGKWGINSVPVSCPNCGETPPSIRKPANRKQAMWGGWTCKQCGTEYDKYGQAEA